jgi:hypothetical protein
MHTFKAAIVTLVHHAYVDGVGAAYHLRQLYFVEELDKLVSLIPDTATEEDMST